MVFGRTKSTIQNLEEQSEINLVDALGIFEDICNDLETELELSLDELETGDEKKIIGLMLHIGQEMVDVLGKNKRKMTNLDRISKIEKQENKLLAELTALEESKNETERLIAVKESLMKAKKDRAEQDKQKMIVSRECDELEKEKERYEQVILPDYDQKKRNLKTEIVDLEKQIEDSKKTGKVLLRDLNSHQTDLKIIEEENKKLGDELSEVSRKISETEISIQRYKNKMDELGARFNSLDEEKKKLIQQINSMDDNISVINIDVLRQRCGEKEKEFAILDRKKKNLETTENSLIVEVTKLQKEIEQLEESIPHKKEEISELECQRDAKKKELEDVIREKDTLKEWFSNLECEQIDSKLKTSRLELDFLKKAVKELGIAMDKDLIMIDKNSKEEVRKMREEAEISVGELTDKLNHLQTSYAIISKAIYAGGDKIL